MVKRPRIKVSKDKAKIRKWAVLSGLKVIWCDEKGYWHGATDRRNTPLWATDTEDLDGKL